MFLKILYLGFITFCVSQNKDKNLSDAKSDNKSAESKVKDLKISDGSKGALEEDSKLMTSVEIDKTLDTGVLSTEKEDPWETLWTNKEVIQEDDVQKLLNQGIPAAVSVDLPESVTQELTGESNGAYQKEQETLKKCSELPLNEVWKNFAPFFKYKNDDKFKNFAALFLAIWKWESLYAMPLKGVHVQPNCKKKPPIVMRPLPGFSIKADLKRSAQKDKVVKDFYGKKCKINRADFGPLQWNYHWRLSQSDFRADSEKALMIATHYPKNEIKKLTQKQIGSLIKYNSKALFLLAGLSLKKTAHKPVDTIRKYNVKSDYRKRVNDERIKNKELIKTCQAKNTSSK